MAETEAVMNLEPLIAMSGKYGSDPEYVLAGGGNTSYKEGGVMAVKASGEALSDIGEDGFVLMDVDRLRGMTEAEYPDEDDAREACAIRDMMAARLEGQGEKRPSVECILHGLFPQKYVLHVHPALVNGLTCGRSSAKAAAELYAQEASGFLWIPLTKPGFVLSKVCADMFAAYNKEHGMYPEIVMLQNHGIFAAADGIEGIDRIMEDLVRRVSGRILRQPEFGADTGSNTGAGRIAAELEKLTGCKTKYLVNGEIARFVRDREAYAPLLKPFTPDHIVYCRAWPLFAESAESIPEGLSDYEERYGYTPKILAVRGIGVFALGKDENEASKAGALFLDAVKIAVYSESFGGPLPLPDEFTRFIANWEIESYRQKKAFS